jgi:hypothetical protein
MSFYAGLLIAESLENILNHSLLGSSGDGLKPGTNAAVLAGRNSSNGPARRRQARRISPAAFLFPLLHLLAQLIRRIAPVNGHARVVGHLDEMLKESIHFVGILEFQTHAGCRIKDEVRLDIAHAGLQL